MSTDSAGVILIHSTSSTEACEEACEGGYKMSKLGFVFAVIVLALAPVMPMAASPDPGSVTGSPTLDDSTNQVLGQGADIGSTGVTTAHGTLGYLTASPNTPGPEGGPDPQAMEDFRRDLLSIADALNTPASELISAASSPATTIPRTPTGRTCLTSRGKAACA